MGKNRRVLELLKKEIIMNALVDKEGCISCGLCISACPEVFRFDADGKAEAYAQVTEALASSAEEALEACPVTVITIES